MGGGLLNLVAYGNQNLLLNGNPTKTFFKATYAKYTNFGLQKFRIDFTGQRNLRLTEPSIFTFTIPRYADLLMDTYLVLDLPTIWSPVMPPYLINDSNTVPNNIFNNWQPYEFRWIENIGSQMIDKIRFTVGGVVIQEVTGQYLYNLVERDFSADKKNLYYEMTGNTAELNNPAFANGRNGAYPSAFNGDFAQNNIYREIYSQTNSQPSIPGRKIYIPINVWFTLASTMAFPLVSLQYAELQIEVTIKAVQDLFTIRKIKTPEETLVDTDLDTFGDYIRPNFVEEKYAFYRFLQSPPVVDIRTSVPYIDKRTDWNTDIHLVSTYAFLGDDEIRVFASKPQTYLIKEAYYTLFENVVGTKKLDLYNSAGLVANWMWFLQRSDAYLRNEWSNYSNWPYNIDPHPPFSINGLDSSNYVPNTISIRNSRTVSPLVVKLSSGTDSLIYPPHTNENNSNNQVTPNLYNTGLFELDSVKEIMLSWGLLLDGAFRETSQPAGVLNYIEKYKGTPGYAAPGLYCYNFCLNTNPFIFQPSGALNVSKFTNVQFEVATIQPPLNPESQFSTICANDGPEVIGTQMPNSGIYYYQYNLVLLEERYNILRFQNGLAALEWSR